MTLHQLRLTAAWILVTVGGSICVAWTACFLIFPLWLIHVMTGW